MYIGLHVKYPLFLSDCNEPWIFWTSFQRESSNIKFHQGPSSWKWVFPCGQTDMTKLFTILWTYLRKCLLTWFIMYAYVETIMANTLNSLYNLLISIHSPWVAFIWHLVLKQWGFEAKVVVRPESDVMIDILLFSTVIF